MGAVTVRRVVPIPGASRPESIRDSALAADLVLTDAELAALSASVGICLTAGDVLDVDVET